MGIAQTPGFWVWLFFFLFVLSFLIVIIVLFASGYKTPKESEQNFTFPNLVTSRHGNQTVNVYLKIRLRGGTKEENIPCSPTYETIIAVFLNDLTTYPATTAWNILAQCIGKEIIKKKEEVAGISLMIETGSPIVQRAIYTEGYLSPIEKF